MNREVLLTRLEHCLLVIGKGMYAEPLGDPECSPAQNHVLMVAGIEGDTSIKQLAEILHVTSGATTQHVDALEKAGLLTRSINPEDRREVLVKTTQKGKAVFEELRQKKSLMLSKLFGGLSEDELLTLVELIEKVSHHYSTNEKGAHGTI